MGLGGGDAFEGFVEDGDDAVLLAQRSWQLNEDGLKLSFCQCLSR